MNGVMRTGLIIAGGTGVGTMAGIGVIAAHRHHNAGIAREEGASWDAWKSKLDGAFPDRALPTDAEDTRFEQFLRANPAPEWLDIKHEHLRKISIDADNVLDGRGVIDKLGGTPTLVGLGLTSATIGAGTIARSSRVVNKFGARAAVIGTALSTAGIAATATALIGWTQGYPPLNELRDRVRASEYQVPDSWKL
jgi:hypothetical protein